MPSHMGRRQIVNGVETDAYSRWGRRYLCYIQRAGVRKSIKRSTHRRERRDKRAAIRESAA